MTKNYAVTNNIMKMLIAALMITAVVTSFYPILRVVYPLRYYEMIEYRSEEYALDKFLVMGLIKAESNYIHDAKSKVAYGLMQLTEETAREIAERMNMDTHEINLNDPKTNIEIGCYYLNFLYNYYGNIDVALAAYNAGMGNVNRWLSNDMYSSDGKSLYDIPFPETKKYVKNVKKYAWIYSKLYSDKYMYANV